MFIQKLMAAGIISVMMLVISVVPVSAAAVNTNGSFESGVDPGVFLPINAVDITSINDWTVSAGNVDYIGSYWTASNGNRSLDLTGSNGSAGAVSQTFATVAGHTYVVTFDLAGNPDGGPVIKTLEVDAGSAATTYTFDTTGSTLADMGWVEEEFEFTATSNSTTLTFTSLDAGFFGPALDDVVVTDVLKSTNHCKKDGWMAYSNPSFRNQGDCISYLQSSSNATGNRKDN